MDLKGFHRAVAPRISVWDRLLSLLHPHHGCSLRRSRPLPLVLLRRLVRTPRGRCRGRHLFERKFHLLTLSRKKRPHLAHGLLFLGLRPTSIPVCQPLAMETDSQMRSTRLKSPLLLPPHRRSRSFDHTHSRVLLPSMVLVTAFTPVSSTPSLRSISARL